MEWWNGWNGGMGGMVSNGRSSLLVPLPSLSQHLSSISLPTPLSHLSPPPPFPTCPMWPLLGSPISDPIRSISNMTTTRLHCVPAAVLSCARVFTMLMCSHALMLAARHSPQVLTGILVTHACCSRVSAAEARKAAEKAAEAAALEATARTSPVASGASRRTSGTRSRAVTSSLDEHPSSPMPVSHLVGPPLSTASMERLMNIDRYTLWKGRIV